MVFNPSLADHVLARVLSRLRLVAAASPAPPNKGFIAGGRGDRGLP